MKRIVILAFLLLSLVCKAQDTLLSDWEMRSGEICVKAQVPCTVAGALEQSGYYGSSLLEGDNYFKQDKSIFDSPWIFSTEFKTQKGKRYVLNFDALSYYADIYLNGRQIASRDTTFGVFLRRSYDISELVRSAGTNKLQVKLYRAQTGDLNNGYVDWNPRPLDENMGIIGNVTLVKSSGVLIDDIYIKPDLSLPSMESAELSVEIAVRNLEKTRIKTELTVDFCGNTYSFPVALEAGERKIVKLDSGDMESLHVNNPKVWWTYDLGAPYMYSISAAAAIDGKESSCKTADFGIRSISSYLDSDNRRHFVLNGRPVLIKGAGWTDDIFKRDTHESNELQVKYVRDMGMNCIRFENIWGKDDNIYDLCDRYGILSLVGWSCQWEWEDYCGIKETKGFGCINTPELNDLVSRYFHDQVIRLRNHPSVCGWMVGSDRIPNPELEKRYLEIYSQNDYRPYICSAKEMTSLYGGPSGTKMEGPYEYVGPEYWYLDTKCGGAFGFNTETGVGMNIPQIPSLEKMMPSDSLWPLSSSYDKHCTASSSAMNSTRVISKVIAGQFGEPASLEEFVNRAHSVDYDATRAMFESFRCNMPGTSGIVQWMLNSAWPSLYWQLYDYYMLPTAAYYATKKACEPVQLVFNYKDRGVYVVNESGSDFTGEAEITILDANSIVISKQVVSIESADNSSKKVFDCIQEGQPVFLSLILRDKKSELADNFYCLPSESNQYEWNKANWYWTPISKYADMSFVTDLPDVELSHKVQRNGLTVTVTLTNNSNTVSYQNILRAVDASGDILTPAFWSDNFVTLLPGQTKTLTCELEKDTTCNIALQGWNSTLADDGARDRSKYAKNSFSQDDRYHVDDPYETVSVQQPKGRKVKNVIFMIGDGMGVEQVSVAWVLNGGHLNMDNCPYSGFSRTYSANKLITDSAAGGSALATGVKTNYGYMACDTDGNPVESLITYAQSKGKKTGVIATCRLNDCTPFNYIGHSTDRHEEEANAAQYVGSNLDFISGGGLQFWENRTDGRNLVKEMKDLGYDYSTSVEELCSSDGSKILALLAPTEMAPALERGDYLELAAQKAIETLDCKEGFFLMIEGSCIDDWAHKNKIGYVAEEIFDFDRTLGKVLEWAEKDGQTLVIVVADHSTGGLTLLGGSLDERSVKVHFSTKGHNGILVPVFAYGPHADDFTGVMENAEVGQKVSKYIK